MTYSKSVTIWCDADDCEEWIEPSQRNAYLVREVAEERGWVTGLSGGRDYCPEHSHLASDGEQ